MKVLSYPKIKKLNRGLKIAGGSLAGFVGANTAMPLGVHGIPQDIKALTAYVVAAAAGNQVRSHVKPVSVENEGQIYGHPTFVEFK